MPKKFKVFHLIIFFVIVIFIIISLYLIIRFFNEKKAYEPYEKIKESGINIIMNGDYLTYVSLGEAYVEPSAIIYDNGKKVSDDVTITYYKNDEQVFSVDTRYSGDYLVQYEYGNKVVNRTVIVCDREKPKFNDIETKEITDLEASIYDVNDGVMAYDNSGKVNVSCENSLGTLPGNYVISCKAIDPFNNINTKKRLIKVVDGIKFNYDNNLEIIFPKDDDYIYKYSLDGGLSFTECNQIMNLDVNSGSVIAAVYINDEFLMSNTYYIK